jgi:hypothetical protein
MYSTATVHSLLRAVQCNSKHAAPGGLHYWLTILAHTPSELAKLHHTRSLTACSRGVLVYSCSLYIIHYLACTQQRLHTSDTCAVAVEKAKQYMMKADSIN